MSLLKDRRSGPDRPQGVGIFLPRVQHQFLGDLASSEDGHEETPSNLVPNIVSRHATLRAAGSKYKRPKARPVSACFAPRDGFDIEDAAYPSIEPLSLVHVSLKA